MIVVGVPYLMVTWRGIVICSSHDDPTVTDGHSGMRMHRHCSEHSAELQFHERSGSVAG
jgi:hypothetical protein